MWAKASEGEGMFTSYNFQANKAYRISLSAFTQFIGLGIPGSSLGKIRVFAVNGLTKPGFAYGSPPPNVNDNNKQLIGDYQVSALGSHQITLDFVANKNYAQIWIYPVGNTNQDQFNLGIRTVGICKDTCVGEVTYNQFSIPVGETRAANIYVGGTAGTGGSGSIVANGQYVSTSLIASNEILFVKETALLAGINNGFVGNFQAVVIPCTINTRIKKGEEKLTLVQPLQDTTHYEHLSLRAYPSISSGLINISVPVELNNSYLTVHDIQGRQVSNRTKINNQRTIFLDLQHLSSGIYILQMTKGSYRITNKIVISK